MLDCSSCFPLPLHASAADKCSSRLVMSALMPSWPPSIVIGDLLNSLLGLGQAILAANLAEPFVDGEFMGNTEVLKRLHEASRVREHDTRQGYQRVRGKREREGRS
ncbi:Os08g0460466 [Oryza sativa Japonica Group]|uniref:Os08g0460466 protein n=1 Tax=Oryza sativa subsp. japonica TaxID=39947 RepID=A0A0P0XGG4_ORYSJ|nr:Os08g0460466 [Oryza sativa Japonica Group]